MGRRSFIRVPAWEVFFDYNHPEVDRTYAVYKEPSTVPPKIIVYLLQDGCKLRGCFFGFSAALLS